MSKETKTFAVARISFFDNELKVKVVSAPNWRDALIGAFNVGDYDNFPDTIKEAKEAAFNNDWMFDVVEVTT